MRVPLKDARIYAQQVVDFITPFCSRVEIAGSIRRECEFIGDIDIVCQPHFHYNETLMEEKEYVSHMDACKLADLGKVTANGSRLKKLGLHTKYGAFACQINIVIPPAEWGIKLFIATGPDPLPRMAVTRTIYPQGLLSAAHCVKDGQLHLLKTMEVIHTPEEKDFFEYINLNKKYLDPKERDYFSQFKHKQ